MPDRTEEQAFWAHENWLDAYYPAQHVLVLSLLSRRCPTCNQIVATEPEYEGEDRSVGIFGERWVNVCPTDGTFLTYDDYTQEMDSDA